MESIPGNLVSPHLSFTKVQLVKPPLNETLSGRYAMTVRVQTHTAPAVLYKECYRPPALASTGTCVPAKEMIAGPKDPLRLNDDSSS